MPSDPSHREEPAPSGRSLEIPEPIRAAAGLAATLLDQARHLPSAVTGLPVRVAGLAMQASLRLQQRYAGLVVKGDEILTQLGRSDDGDPAWATFDDDVVDIAGAITEGAGVDVTAADGSATPPATPIADSDVALPPLPGMTRTRPDRAAPTATEIGHPLSAFDRAADVPVTSGLVTGRVEPATVDGASNGHNESGDAPVPGYDAFTLAQLRARLRTFDAATLRSLLEYERGQRAREPYLMMLESRLHRGRGQG